ncbi:MAG: conjugal transfer protein TrbM, partial [Nitrospira sp. LK265]|nr:conjugal transfer protein TrbM [Nitrospira sp. LK265]
RLACECLLCLAAGPQAPKECQAALTKYYMIQAGSPFKTMVMRRNFLQLCPKQ